MSKPRLVPRHRATVQNYDRVAVATGTRNMQFRHGKPVRDERGEPVLKARGSDPLGSKLWVTIERKARVPLTKLELRDGNYHDTGKVLDYVPVTYRYRELDDLAGEFLAHAERRERKATVCLCKGGRVNHKCRIHADQITTGKLYVCPKDGVHYRKRYRMQDCCLACWERGVTPMARAFKEKSGE